MKFAFLGPLVGALARPVGGWIADKFGKNDLRAYMVTPAIASLITITFGA